MKFRWDRLGLVAFTIFIYSVALYLLPIAIGKVETLLGWNWSTPPNIYWQGLASLLALTATYILLSLIIRNIIAPIIIWFFEEE